MTKKDKYSKRSLPKISVITPSFNQGKFINETILSVLGQEYPNIEYIIIDGGSTDNSCDVISHHKNKLAYWASEPDKGQADAINKGIKKATGDIIAFLNSDDIYLPGALFAAGFYFVNYPDAQWLCGHGMMFGRHNQPPTYLKVRVPRRLAEVLFTNMIALSPSSFWRRELFDQHGTFDTQLHYFFDVEFYARLLIAGIKCKSLDYPICGYRLHEESKTVAQAKQFNEELLVIRDKYLPQVSSWQLQREYARERWRLSEESLYEAISLWRSGKEKRGLDKGLGALYRSPTGFMLSCLKWIGRKLVVS